MVRVWQSAKSRHVQTIRMLFATLFQVKSVELACLSLFFKAPNVSKRPWTQIWSGRNQRPSDGPWPWGNDETGMRGRVAASRREPLSQPW
eukprot:symbB.v1.2.023273.t1/scaffold2119.1/size88723/5